MKQQRRGFRGIYYDDKPHLLYCIMMLQKVCNVDDGKYVSDYSAFNYWRKADILPVTWNYDINNNVGSTILAHSKKVISDDICNDLCNLMVDVAVKA